MELIIAPKEIRSGTEIHKFRSQLDIYRKEYYLGNNKYHLDMSDVIFMDSTGFRTIFDFLPIFTKVTPPKSQWVIETYNLWLDSKKGLEK